MVNSLKTLDCGHLVIKENSKREHTHKKVKVCETKMRQENVKLLEKNTSKNTQITYNYKIIYTYQRQKTSTFYQNSKPGSYFVITSMRIGAFRYAYKV